MNNLNSNDPSMLLAQVRLQLSQSPQIFAKIYLGHYFQKKSSRMHQALFEQLQQASEKRGVRLAVAAPRGHAKSTLVSLAYVLWSVCHNKERFILLMSNTASQAIDLLDHVKKELESNTLLREDFPEVCEAIGSKPGPPRWRKSEIITRNQVRVLAVGVGTPIRGKRFKKDRPTLIILDDIENDESSRSEVERNKLWDWLHRAVIPAGSEITNVIVVGTLLHYDAVLARLIDRNKSTGWNGMKYQAIEVWSAREDLWKRWESILVGDQTFQDLTGPDAAQAFYVANEVAMLEGTKVLWPEHEPYLTLMHQRLEMGTAAFEAEKQNEPLDPATCVFKEEDFHFWDDRFRDAQELLDYYGSRGIMIGACDPSMGKQGHAQDFTAIISALYVPSEGVIYVLDADIAKRPPDETIETIIQYQKIWKYDDFIFETVQFQEFMGSELRRRSMIAHTSVPVRQRKHCKDKFGRIQALQPKVRSGVIKFHHNQRLLLEQLRQFPKAAHDDGPDALEMVANFRRPARPKVEFADLVPLGPRSNTYFLAKEYPDDELRAPYDEWEERCRRFLHE